MHHAVRHARVVVSPAILEPRHTSARKVHQIEPLAPRPQLHQRGVQKTQGAETRAPWTGPLPRCPRSVLPPPLYQPIFRWFSSSPEQSAFAPQTPVRNLRRRASPTSLPPQVQRWLLALLLLLLLILLL